VTESTAKTHLPQRPNFKYHYRNSMSLRRWLHQILDRK